MNNYVVLTESTADINFELVKKYGIEVMPMEFILDGESHKHYADSREYPLDKFYDALKSGSKSKTSQINFYEMKVNIEEYLKKGLDVLYIAFSSGLSGTYNNAVMAAQELKEEYPDRKILVCDSLAASSGEGMLAVLAAKLKEEGKDIDYVYNYINENKLHLISWFTVDDLNHLKRGGRISSATAIVGTALNIKPILHVDNEGHLQSFSKTRGRKLSVKKLSLNIANDIDLNKSNLIFICHANCLKDAKEAKEILEKEIDNCEVVISYMGPVIGSHTGPGGLALFCMGDSRE